MSTTAMPQSEAPLDKILFFDGVCIMCNSLVRFVLQHDKKHEVRFATLQGATATRYLPEALRTDLNTVAFYDERGIHTESDAILRLFKAMGGWLSIATVLFIFPRFFRNFVYGVVATNRYRWFGITQSCALLSPEQKQRILD